MLFKKVAGTQSQPKQESSSEIASEKVTTHVAPQAAKRSDDS